jgi:hypothetical protein
VTRSGLYLTRADPYDAVLPVIWDEGRRTEEHSALKAGLAAIEGVVHSVVIAKPGLMFAEQPKNDNRIDIRSKTKETDARLAKESLRQIVIDALRATLGCRVEDTLSYQEG